LFTGDAFGSGALGPASISATDFMLMNVLGWDINVTDSWNVGSSGDFAAGTNWKPLSKWSTGIAPGPAINAQITTSGIYTVTSSSDAYVSSLATAKGVTLAINSGTFTVSSGTGTGANAGTIVVGDGAVLKLGGTVKNIGAIDLDAVSDTTALTLTADVSLTGAGKLTLSDSSQNMIAAAARGPTVTLTNVANTISGAGTIGDGTGNLKLVNQKIINATGADSALVIHTGNTDTNSATLEGTGAGGLTLEDDINNIGGVILAAAAAGPSVNLDDIKLTGGRVSVATDATMLATGGGDTLTVVD
jgi:hypothetical protein